MTIVGVVADDLALTDVTTLSDLVRNSMGDQRFGITPLDPATYGFAIAALVVIALVACAMPAARATRVDPVVALRQD